MKRTRGSDSSVDNSSGVVNPKPMGAMGVQYNKKGILAALVGGAVVLYVIYQMMPSPKSGGQLRRHETWRTQEFVDIPADILKRATEIRVTERTTAFPFDGKKVEIFYREVQPEGAGPIPILFLHGASFKSETWQDIKTIQTLAAAGFRVVAIDLPGYGRTKKQIGINRSTFIAKIIKQLDLGKPVIVSPSMSGTYALPFIMNEHLTCHKRISGFVPVAPVGTQQYEHHQYYKCQAPVMIVYGQDDKDLGIESLGDLRNMKNSEIFEVPDSRHATYMNKPKYFNWLMYNFMLAVQRYHGV